MMWSTSSWGSPIQPQRMIVEMRLRSTVGVSTVSTTAVSLIGVERVLDSGTRAWTAGRGIRVYQWLWPRPTL